MGWLSDLLRPSSNEARAIPYDKKVWRGAITTETASGVDVSPQSALSYLALFACVRVLAESVAGLPLILYQRTNTGKSRATNNSLYEILHLSPNPEMSSFTLRETLMGHVLTWGNGYAEIEWGNDGRVRALWPLRPDKMKVARENGELVYGYTLKNETYKLPSYRILHLRGLGFDGIVGYSPVQIASQAIGLGLATEQFGGAFFGNGALPGGVLEHPGSLSDEAYANIKKGWVDMHSGLDNSHRVAILEEGLKYNQVGIPPEAAQFLETRKFQRSEMAMLYRVPPHMIADLDRATFSNIEHQGIEFVSHSLRPWLVRIEQSMNRSLLLPSERQRLYVEHLVDALLRGDTKARYDAYATGRQWGWLSANDVRKLENMNPVSGGDTYLVPLNMIPSNSSESQRTASRVLEKRAEGDERHNLLSIGRRLFARAVGDLLQRERRDVLEALHKLSDALLAEWIVRYYRDEFKGIASDTMGGTISTYADMVISVAAHEANGSADDVDLTAFINAYISGYATRHAARHEERLMAVWNESGADGVTEFAESLENESERIANEESVRLNNATAKAVYLALGVQRLRWVAFGDNCPYCTSLNGQVVGINRFFLSAGSEFFPDGAERPLLVSRNVGHAPAHQGCDCMVVAA